jgi:hypothetical protein
MAVVFTHILHDCDFRIYLTLGHLTFCQKRTHSRTVLFQIVVLYVTNAICIVCRWRMEVVIETESALWLSE